MTKRVSPTDQVQVQLLDQYGPVVGVDEVGRGAIAGPLAVGAVLVDDCCGPGPQGLADSKLISAARRESLVMPIRRWAAASAVGWATSDEVTAHGVTGALRLAGLRALELISRASANPAACILLDGKHDWLTGIGSKRFPEPNLFDGIVDPYPGVERIVGSVAGALSEYETGRLAIPVVTKVKADMSCEVVAAASILAKVARDHYMQALPDPGYGWSSNKGYASSVHTSALSALGPCEHHRLGWNLPGVKRGEPLAVALGQEGAM